MLFDKFFDKLKGNKKEPDTVPDELKTEFNKLSSEIKLDTKLALELAASYSDYASERLVSEIKTHEDKLFRLKENAKTANRLDLYDEIIRLQALADSAKKFCGLLNEKKTSEIVFPEKINEEIRLFSEVIKDESTEKSEIEKMKKSLREKQIRRMQKGKFTTRAGLMYLEMIEGMSKLKF